MLDTTDFNQQLLNALNDAIPLKAEQVTFLMETIHLGREAAYRRLRNEVLFSFNEAVMIAQKLKISLDNIVSVSSTKTAPSFQLYPSLYGFNKDYKCYYDDYNDEHDIIFDKLMHDPTVKLLSAYDTMPHTILFGLKTLSRFRAFKWHYQQNRSNVSFKFSSVELSSSVFRRHLEMAHQINYFPEVTLIFGRNVFMRLIKEIKYFYNLYLITDEEISLLKSELLELIKGLETLAVTGKTPFGSDMLLYLSNIDFDLDYSYIKGKDYEQSFINIYQMNTLASIDPDICSMQKKWIESLRRYSTLITLSGEVERINFFKAQRELVESITA